MDPSVFMLAPLSMTNAKYQLWRNGISYVERVMNELDYDKFSDARHRPSLIAAICVHPLLIYFHLSFALLHMMIFKWNTYARLAWCSY